MSIYRFSMVILLFTGAPVFAQPTLPRIGTDPVRDLRLTMQARKRMFDDPELAALNVGVTVNDRAAVLWGPVPTVEAMFRAELTLRGMTELVEIRNQLFVSELEPIRAPLKFDAPPRFLPERAPPPPKLPVEPRPFFGAPGVLTGQANKIAVLPAITLGMPSADETPAAPERDLNGAIRIFLQSKTTYRPLEFTLKDRRVYLRAPDQHLDALHEAARGIARLPGVEGVILLDKASPR